MKKTSYHPTATSAASSQPLSISSSWLMSTFSCFLLLPLLFLLFRSYLEVSGYDGVYALGDCASITNPHTGKPYPPTAQHAIRQGKVVAKNIVSAIKGKGKREGKKKKFDYKTKGMMAEIGKRTGVAILFGRIKLHGFLAWWLWRSYYLANLPTAKKKLKVMGDWTSDLLFKPDVSQVS